MLFPTSYQSILDRIDQVDPVKYARTRNFIDGNVTYLSPYISRGVITVKQVMDAVLAKGYKAKQIEKFLQELAWREYWQRIWQAKGNDLFADLKQPQPGVDHQRIPSAIIDAETGIDAIDNAIRALYDTGYMHNHIRMYTASITCNIARAHWLQPSRWMYYHLLDGDLASNSLSWQWVAGSFSSKKYYCNQENINKYTYSDQKRTFLDSSYEHLVEMPVPAVLQTTSDFALKTTLPNSDRPRIDQEKPTLVYNSYNLDPDWHSDRDVNRILLLEPSHFEKYPVSDRVINFISGLAANIKDLQLFTGEYSELQALCGEIIFKEHPAFVHYEGVRENRQWIAPAVSSYFPSFFSYWKKVEKQLF